MSGKSVHPEEHLAGHNTVLSSRKIEVNITGTRPNKTVKDNRIHEVNKIVENQIQTNERLGLDSKAKTKLLPFVIIKLPSRGSHALLELFQHLLPHLLTPHLGSSTHLMTCSDSRCGTWQAHVTQTM